MRQPHPSEAQLALYAGGDLGFWERRRVRGHVSSCPECRHEVNALRSESESLRELASGMPADLNWSRISEEMTGNIHVGLAAGECIAGFEKTVRPVRPRLAWQAALVLGGAAAAILAGLAFDTPRNQIEHLRSAMGQIRWDRIGKPVRNYPPVAQDSVILEASPIVIEVKSNGHALALMHPRSDGATVSVNMQDSAGVRYVDADSGQVTMNKVYYAQ